MTKILITGFRHSGTTLLMSLLRSHPQVGWIEFEESFIEFDKPKKWLVSMAQKQVPNLKEKAWGEKIPWGMRPQDKDCSRAIAFTKKWLKYFKKDARVIHIIRHPIDVASSGREDGNPDLEVKKEILSTVPKYLDFISNNLNCKTIVYEDLVQKPKKHLKNIFKFCELQSNDKILHSVVNTNLKFDKINPDRAFAFKKVGAASDTNYEEIISKIKLRL